MSLCYTCVIIGDTMVLESTMTGQLDAWHSPPQSLLFIMGTTMSEPCIYDKLSESIDILRQSGYRYGMSEREIERFIKQVLETNEPRREPPQFPILRATIKVRPSNEDFVSFQSLPTVGFYQSTAFVKLSFCQQPAFLTQLLALPMPLCSLQFVLVVGLLLVMVLAFIYPQSTQQLGLANLGTYNWSSPLSHVRLLSLPIAKKYNLQGSKHIHSISPLKFPHKLAHIQVCTDEI